MSLTNVPNSRLEAPESSAVEAALAGAERKGFRLAVIGRTCALVAIAFFYLTALRYPNNIYVAMLILTSAAVGLAPLELVGRRYERIGRYAFFAFDATVISAILAVAPVSSSGDVPQNLVFLSNRPEYYFVLVAISILALSPALVLWTGLCAVVGLTGATAWVMAGMERIVRLGDLPQPFSREDYLAIVLNPDFLGIAFRVNEGIACIGDVHRGAGRSSRTQRGPGSCSRRGRESPYPRNFRALCPGAGGRAAHPCGTACAPAARGEHHLCRHRRLHTAGRILATLSRHRTTQQFLQRGDGDHR